MKQITQSAEAGTVHFEYRLQLQQTDSLVEKYLRQFRLNSCQRLAYSRFVSNEK